MNSLTPAEQRELETRVQARQMKDFMNLYSNLVQRCFDNCVNDFTSSKLSSREEGCVFKCVDKILKSNERLSLRFQEQNAAMMGQGGISNGP